MSGDTNNNTSNEGKIKEMYSPYDWEAFGFKIYGEDRDSHILSESPLIQPILQYVDENGDGKMSVEEFSRHKGNKNIRDLLSKMICVHRSEWAYSGDAFANLKKEVEKYYDEEIKRLNPDNENARTECESKRNEDLKLFEEKVKNLTFLDQIKFDNKSSLPDGYFYFFHPIAFVEQMKMMAIKKISKYLTIEKATYSETAKKNRIKNSIDTDEHYENLMYLGCEIYDILYEHFGNNLRINSCYRNRDVNALVKGSTTSQHCIGQAIDLSVSGSYENRDIIQYIFDNAMDYDQIIWEFGNNNNPQWVHVSLKKKGNRQKLTRSITSKGKTIYSDLNIKTVKLHK